MYTEAAIRRIPATLGRVHAAASTLPETLALMDESHNQRNGAEDFIRAVFHAAYGANITSFYPLLMGIRQNDEEYVAIAGIRPAGSTPLFSEHYLDRPVEQLLSANRSDIAEIGNLAPANAGQARWLICALSAFLIGAGFRHVVFTSVPRLRNAFGRMGLPLTLLANADRQCLPAAEREEWGSYYDCKPAVYAGDIVAGTPALKKLMASDPRLLHLSQRAGMLGRTLVGKAAA